MNNNNFVISHDTFVIDYCTLDKKCVQYSKKNAPKTSAIFALKTDQTSSVKPFVYANALVTPAATTAINILAMLHCQPKATCTRLRAS